MIDDRGEQPTIRCRCAGCQGPPICRCCNEPVVEIPDDEPAAHEDPRAEAAILSAAEAYRLVEEARQMREERDAALVRIAYLERQSAGRLEAWEADLASSQALSAEHGRLHVERDAAMAEVKRLRGRLQRADHLAEVVSRAIIVAQYREACDHPACPFIRGGST